MCDWNEQDPHRHVNPVNRFDKHALKNFNHAIDTRH